MITIFMILSIWLIFSLPLSVVLGASMRQDTPPELVGMDGDLAVYRDRDGGLHRVRMINRAAA